MSSRQRQLSPVIRQIQFPCGHRIDVHKIEDGVVWYQVWRPRQDSQNVSANLFRKSVDDFNEQVAEKLGAYVPNSLH